MVSFSVILIYNWPVKTELVDLFILEKILIEKILQFDWIRNFRALICERLSPHCLQKRIGDQQGKSNETILQKLLKAPFFWKILNLLWFFDPIEDFSREIWPDLVYQSLHKTLRNEPILDIILNNDTNGLRNSTNFTELCALWEFNYIRVKTSFPKVCNRSASRKNDVSKFQIKHIKTKDVSRTLSIVSGIWPLIILAKRLHYRCLTGS